MTDTALLDLLDTLAGRPRLTIGDRRYIHIDGAVLEWHRVGKRERWAFSPGRDVRRVDRLPEWWPRQVREWVRRAEILNFVAHGRAMGARSL